MNASHADYLQICLEQFSEITRKLYKRAFNLRAIEHSVRRLQSQETLTYDDLRYFESPEHWWFEKFWIFPSEGHLAPALKKQKFNFWRLPHNEENVVTGLVETFRSIELVSVILRFIKPKDSLLSQR